MYGVNLNGDYDPNLSTDQLKLTTPSLDLSLATSVVLGTNQTLVIGGLIREDMAEDRDRIPYAQRKGMKNDSALFICDLFLWRKS